MSSRQNDFMAQFPGMIIIHQKIPQSEVGRHEHQEHEFFLPLQGEISVQSDLTTAKAGPGKMLYVPPNLDHSFSSTAQGSGERLIWLIENKLWKKHTDRNFDITVMPTQSLAKELLFYLLTHQNAEGAKYFISALIASLVDSLTARQEGHGALFTQHLEGRTSDVRIKKVMKLLADDLAEISLTDIATESGLSLRNLNRLFLKEVGMTPKSYVVLRRVEKAKQLLKETRMTITDISLEVGYNSLSKFIEAFKRIEGQLPSDYRGL